jgi:hypothetical protein
MFFLVLVVICVPIFTFTISFVNAFLYENGTCTDEKVKETTKQVINTNGTVDDFLKSLPSDNTILAEIVC